MEKDLLTIISDNGEERYKLLAVIDNQYILYTTLTNINPIDNINIIKVKSLDELDVIPITKNEMETIYDKYNDLLK